MGFLERIHALDRMIKNSAGMQRSLALEERGLLFYDCKSEIEAVIEAAHLMVQSERRLANVLDVLDEKSAL